MIADAVSSTSSKEDNNLIVFLESERMRAEEKERIRQDERADERRREDNSFQMQMQMMMMMMMNPVVFQLQVWFHHLLPLKQALLPLLRQLRNSMGKIASIWSCYEEPQLSKTPFLSFFLL